jgi:hypothetical protein
MAMYFGIMMMFQHTLLITMSSAWNGKHSNKDVLRATYLVGGIIAFAYLIIIAPMIYYYMPWSSGLLIFGDYVGAGVPSSTITIGDDIFILSHLVTTLDIAQAETTAWVLFVFYILWMFANITVFSFLLDNKYSKIWITLLFYIILLIPFFIIIYGTNMTMSYQWLVWSFVYALSMWFVASVGSYWIRLPKKKEECIY